MKKLSFVFDASASCIKSIKVPSRYKTKGKSYDEIYDEVYHLYGEKDDIYINNNLVGMDEFHNMHIEVEGIRAIFKMKNGNINIVKDNP